MVLKIQISKVNLTFSQDGMKMEIRGFQEISTTASSWVKSWLRHFDQQIKKFEKTKKITDFIGPIFYWHFHLIFQIKIPHDGKKFALDSINFTQFQPLL